MLLAGMLTANGQSAVGSACPIFPQPKQYRVKGEDVLTLSGPVTVVVGEKAGEPENFAASRLSFVLKKRFDLDVRVVTEKAVPKRARHLLVLGTLESNALLKSLKERGNVDLDPLKDKDPMQDAFALECLKSDGRQVVLMIGTTSRSVIYAQYAFLEAVRRKGRDVVHPDMSVRDWSSLRYRDWWPGNFGTEGAVVYDDTDSLDQVTYARANMTQFRGCNSSVIREDVVQECWRRGLKPYGTVKGAIQAKHHKYVVAETKAWLKKGVYGIYISYDDQGMGQDPEGLCNDVTALIKEHFGEVGDRVSVVTGPAGYVWLNSGQNKMIRGFKDFEEGIFYFTGPGAGAFNTKQHFDHAREAGIKNHIWWHNYPCGIASFYTPARAARYYALLPFNRNCWGRFTFDDLREGGKHMTGMVAQNEDHHYAALQLFWAWDPAHYEHEKARTAIYRQRHGAAAVEAVRKLDDNMYALSEYYFLMWRNWARRAWMLKDPAKRDEALALIHEMQGQFQSIKEGKKYSYMSDRGYDKNYIKPLEAHLAAGEKLARLDFPDYAVVKREGFNPKGTADPLTSHAAATLRDKMIALIQAGKSREAGAYLADLAKEALPMLDVIEKDLKDLWYTEEYVSGWRRMLELKHWESVAGDVFGGDLSLRVGRNADGKMVIRTSAAQADILFTIDGPAPEVGASEVYSGPRPFAGSCVVRAVGIQKASGLRSRVVEHLLGYPKTDWKITYVDSEGGRGNMAANLIDDNLDTMWMTEQEEKKPSHPHEARIDLGRETVIQGIGIYPDLRIRAGTPRNYEVYAGADGKEWGDPVAAGRFDSIQPRMMIVPKETIKARFIRLVFLTDFWDVHFSSLKEVDVFNLACRPAVEPSGDLRPGLRYRYYETAGLREWRAPNERDTVTSGVVASPSLEIEGRRDDNFAIVYDGYIMITRDGLYMFSLASDDGSILWLDGLPAINNDGMAWRRELHNWVPLAEGYHRIRVAFFEFAGREKLEVHWQPPGGEKEPLPAGVLFHTKL